MTPLLILYTSTVLNQFPAISVTSWSSSDSFIFDTSSPLPTTFVNDTTLVIPSTVGGIVLTCNASYPIEWDIHHEQLQTKGNRRSRTRSFITTTRKSDDIFQPSTFQYLTELTIVGDSTSLTGNYTCLSTDEERELMATNIYVFWEGTSPPFLIYAGENRSLTLENSADSVTLPCKTSRPDITVTLQKFVGTEWVKMNKTTFEPAIGFILTNSTPNATLFGQYKCIANQEPDKDFLLIHVVNKDPTQKPYNFQNSLRRPASFNFVSTNTTSQFICCSKTQNSPPKLMHFYCDHPITCKLKKNALAEIENNGKRTNDEDGRCTAFTLVMTTSGVLRCLGEGIDIVREYFFPMGFQYGFNMYRRRSPRPQNISKPYYGWQEADPDKMLALATQADPIYVGQTVSINCQISKYYFSRGARWMITWKNRTNVLVPEVIKNVSTTISGRRMYRQFFRKNIISIRITAAAEMESIACFAPVWNTSDWKNKSLPLGIQVPIVPTIEGGNLETIEWYLNDTDKQLSCQSSGKPSPIYIRWQKDNQTIPNSRAPFANGTSIFKIPRVSYENHGIYICSTSTFAGKATKTFKVVVYERTSSGTIVVIVLSIFGFIGVLSLVAVLVLRLKTQKTTIRHLATAAFKDLDHPNHQTIASENIYTTSQDIHIEAINHAHLNASGNGNANTKNELPKVLPTETGNYQKL